MSSPSTPRMPRAQRRAQLLELATRVFGEKGYQRTSMDDIAHTAGVTKPVLYQHFTSKETLYAEVLDIIAERMMSEVQTVREVEGGSVERVRFGLELFYRFVSLQNAVRLFTGSEPVPATVQERVIQVLDSLSIELASLLMVTREISDARARILGRSILAAAQSTAVMLHAASGEPEREEILEVMTSAMLHGLTGFAPLEHPQVAGTVLAADGSSRAGDAPVTAQP